MSSHHKKVFNFLESFSKKDKKILVALSISILGFIIFLFIASSVPFKSTILSLFFQKDTLLADVGDSSNVIFVDMENKPMHHTLSPNVGLQLSSPWAPEESVQGTSQIVLQVNAGPDDVNEDGNSYSQSARSTWLGTGWSGDSSWTGYRFSNAVIPQGAVINSAKLLVYTPSREWIWMGMEIRGDNSGNSAAFNRRSRPSGRSLTTALVNHSSNTFWQRNNWHEVTNVASIVQEIVNRSDWNSGNAISIISKGSGWNWARKYAASYERNPSLAPRLEVTYTTVDGDTPSPTPTTITPTATPPTPTIIPPTATPTPTNTPVPPSPTPTPKPAVYTVSVELAEDTEFTKNYTKIGYTSHPTYAGYTFSDDSPGRKTVYVRFTSNTGLTQVFSNWIDLMSPDPTAIPTLTPGQPTSTPGQTSENSLGFGTWTPNSAYDTCTKEEHDSYNVIGPDGKKYATWHPSVHTRPDGSTCNFGHEHGQDPRTSLADNSLPAFGYAAEQIGMAEPHVGFKVFVINQGDTHPLEGGAATSHHRTVFHMGTAGLKRYVEPFHSVEYDYVSTDGSGKYMHIYGMADTGNGTGSTCGGEGDTKNNPGDRDGGRDFSTVGCDDPYEIWGFEYKIKHPDDPYDGLNEVRASATGAVAVFDPITTRDHTDNNRLIYSHDYYQDIYEVGNFFIGVDKDAPATSPDAAFLGCSREIYGGPNFWNNLNRPSSYWTDAYGNVKSGPGPGLIEQQVSATRYDAGENEKIPMETCDSGIHAPN